MLKFRRLASISAGSATIPEDFPSAGSRATQDSVAMIVRRSEELGRLDRLLADLIAGRGRALVLHGEPGIGKTTLLEALVGRAGDDVVVLCARGMQSEAELTFSTMSDLLHPVLSELRALPGLQAEALAGALALGPPAPRDRRAVCVAAAHHGVERLPARRHGAARRRGRTRGGPRSRPGRDDAGRRSQRLHACQPISARRGAWPRHWVSAQPKRFAWTLGLVMALAMTVITNVGIRGALPRTMCLICLTLMWMESALGVCVGCKLHAPLSRRGWTVPGLELCTQGTCEDEIDLATERRAV
jgi:hypothetical protein